MKYNAIILLILLAVMMMTGCEDSDVTAPDGSTITLIAQPAAVFIDQTLGQTEGATTLVAQVVDSGGLPLADIPLFFTTTGGLLTSVSNRCIDGECNRSVNVCANDTDCPLVEPATLKSDNSGLVTDTLTLRLVEDLNVVTVTVKGTNLEQRTEVNKNVNLGPMDAVPIISVNPSGGQRTGLPFTLSASTSTVDSQVEIECYNWQLLSSLPVFDANAPGCVECPVPGSILCSESCEARSTNNPVLAQSFGSVGDPTLDQDIAIVLRLSDDPSIVCENGVAIDDDLFSPVIATINYPIRCDVTTPFVSAGSNQNGSLSASGGTVSVSLTATASDLEDTILDYTWDCGNGDGNTAQTITCSYTSTGVFTATVTVTNDCGLLTADSLVVSIDP